MVMDLCDGSRVIGLKCTYRNLELPFMPKIRICDTYITSLEMVIPVVYYKLRDSYGAKGGESYEKFKTTY